MYEKLVEKGDLLNEKINYFINQNRHKLPSIRVDMVFGINVAVMGFVSFPISDCLHYKLKFFYVFNYFLLA